MCRVAQAQAAALEMPTPEEFQDHLPSLKDAEVILYVTAAAPIPGEK